jgi:hypothetical protein
MTSGSGAPKRVLREEAITFKTSTAELSTWIAEPGSENKHQSILPTPKHQRCCVNTIPLVCGLRQPF